MTEYTTENGIKYEVTEQGIKTNGGISVSNLEPKTYKVKDNGSGKTIFCCGPVRSTIYDAGRADAQFRLKTVVLDQAVYEDMKKRNLNDPQSQAFMQKHEKDMKDWGLTVENGKWTQANPKGFSFSYDEVKDMKDLEKQIKKDQKEAVNMDSRLKTGQVKYYPVRAAQQENTQETTLNDAAKPQTVNVQEGIQAPETGSVGPETYTEEKETVVETMEVPEMPVTGVDTPEYEAAMNELKDNPEVTAEAMEVPEMPVTGVDTPEYEAAMNELKDNPQVVVEDDKEDTFVEVQEPVDMAVTGVDTPEYEAAMNELKDNPEVTVEVQDGIQAPETGMEDNEEQDTFVEVDENAGKDTFVEVDENPGQDTFTEVKEEPAATRSAGVAEGMDSSGTDHVNIENVAVPPTASFTRAQVEELLNATPDIHIETPAPEKKNILKKVKDIFKKKTPEEKAAKAAAKAEKAEAKADKAEAKRQKKIDKAEIKYEKAVEKAKKKLAKDPDNPEAKKKYNKAIAKAEKKRDKKFEKLGATKDDFTEVKAPQSTVEPISAAPTPQTQTPQRTGQSSAYDFGNTGSEPKQPSEKDENSQNTGQENGNDNRSPEEELMMFILDMIMRSYFGPEYGYIGDRMSMRDDMTEAQIDQHSAISQLTNENEQTNQATQEGLENNPAQQQAPAPEQPAVAAPTAPEVDRTPLTDKEQKSFDSWMKTSRISEEDKNKLIEKYGPKDAYNIVQKCMAEPTNVMKTAGVEPTKSKPAIEYFANLDMSKPEDKAKADKVIAMDPPKLNMALLQKQRA